MHAGALALQGWNPPPESLDVGLRDQKRDCLVHQQGCLGTTASIRAQTQARAYVCTQACLVLHLEVSEALSFCNSLTFLCTRMAIRDSTAALPTSNAADLNREILPRSIQA